MNLLYGFLIAMLIIALIILAIPFIKTRQFTLYVASAFFVIATSTGLYHLFGSSQALQKWLNTGRDHYQLMEEYAQFGGVDGIIARIKMKLAANPNDAEGWLILGKLYLAKHDYKAAKEAFTKANELAPNHF